MRQRLAAAAGPHHGGAGRHPRLRGSEAFTLVELMIVTAILTLLTGVIFLTYRRTRDTVQIGTVVDELLGHAKSCALLNTSGVGATPAPPPITAERGGVVITQGCAGGSQGATLEATWGTAKASGIACLGARSQITSSKAMITISPLSTLTCVFED